MKLKIIRLENEYLKIDVSPFGGKIVSMFNMLNGSEWLFQAEEEEFQLAGDGSFDTAVAFGSDEMFPTILPESSRQPDGSIVELPDHGELWSRDWDVVSQTEDTLEMAFDSEILPYRFIRNLILSGNVIICRYTVINTSDSDFPALWTPHPLFSFRKETEIMVPGDCETITQAGNGGPLGAYGNRIHWGEQGFVPDAGKLLKPGTLEEGSAFKFYASEAVSKGEVQIRDKRGRMTMSYSAAFLPWLGFWINNGGFGGHHNIAPEPATAPFDSPSRSEAVGVDAVLRSGEIKEWEVKYRFDL